MNIETVNELILSLESAGELSIREQKFLKLAKAYQQLAAENVAIREQSEEVYAAGYNHGHLNTVDGIAYAGCVKDDFYSLALQVMAEVETPATDAYLAGIKADGVEEFAAKLRIPGDDQFFDALAKGVALAADDFAKQLREGADK
ncbi:TPA: hypothetical protein ACQ7L3_001013 [Klebsiella pneumoniae]